MGRYYDGTIYGKFWFGVQSSADANNFKSEDFGEFPYNFTGKYLIYNFEKSELDFIQDKLKSLEFSIGDDIITKLNYKLENYRCEYEINYSVLKEIDKNTEELIARYCFGKQIETALIEIGECYIKCEL
jgi:hypothetical protein